MKPAANQDDRVWRALADPVRRRVLDALSKRAMTTGSIVAAFDPLCRTAVMKHLDVLAAADLIVIRRAGRMRWNHFNPVTIDRICRRWLDARRVRVSGALSRLKSVAEATLEDPDDPETERTEDEKHRNRRRTRRSIRIRD